MPMLFLISPTNGVIAEPTFHRPIRNGLRMDTNGLMRRSICCDNRGPNNSLDTSGGSASRNLLGAAEGALIRAAASTQPLGGKQYESKNHLCNRPHVIDLPLCLELFCSNDSP